MKVPNLKIRTRLFIIVHLLALFYVWLVITENLDGKAAYTTLRVIVFLLSVLSVYISVKRQSTKGIIIFSVLAVVFNPLINFYTNSKDTWLLIDLVTFGLLIYAIINYLSYIRIPEVRASFMIWDAGLPKQTNHSDYAENYLDLAIKTQKEAEKLDTHPKKDRLKAAKILYRKALTSNPKILQAYVGIGEITLNTRDYIGRNNYDDAIKDLDAGIKLFPKEPELYELRARMKWCKAEELYDRNGELRYKLLNEAFLELSDYLKINNEDESIHQLKGILFYQMDQLNPTLTGLKLMMEMGVKEPEKWVEYYVKECAKHYKGKQKYQRSPP